MTLWHWASRVYAQPGVEVLCLTLQDTHGQCVSYLLWAGWAARQGRRLEPAALNAAAALARDWEVRIVRPLRSVRRALKAPATGPAIPGQDRLRERIGAEELAAERLLLEALEARTPEPDGGIVDLRQALSDAVTAWGGAAADDLLDALCRAFSNT